MKSLADRFVFTSGTCKGGYSNFWDYEVEAEARFGFLLDALELGAPPHGGIAFGLDRMAMILAGVETIHEIIAFPKTTAALSLMDGSPAHTSDKQWAELGLKTIKKGT